MFLPLPQQQVLKKNQIFLSEVSQLENLTVERRGNTKKNILNTDVRISPLTVSSNHNVYFALKYWQMILTMCKTEETYGYKKCRV
jgi:hypothetical protein